MLSKAHGPLLRRLRLVLFVFLGRPAIDDHTDGSVPHFTRGARIHDAALRGIEVVHFRSRLDTIRHGQHFMQLRGREELPALRPDALIFESRLHPLQAAVISQEGIKDLRHIASPVRIHLDGAVLLPIHNNMLPDVTNRRIAAGPVSLFSKAQHIIRNTGRDGFTLHLSEDHRDIHHGAPDRRRGVDIFLY